jgi:hypothetical protein
MRSTNGHSSVLVSSVEVRRQSHRQPNVSIGRVIGLRIHFGAPAIL